MEELIAEFSASDANKKGFVHLCHAKRPMCHPEFISGSNKRTPAALLVSKHKDAPPRQQTLKRAASCSVPAPHRHCHIHTGCRVQGDRRAGYAFTLAEVLITLAIIGVVAALTVPTVIRNYQERQTVTALKKFYTEISQAYARAQVDNSTPDTWDWGTSYNFASNDRILNILAPYLKITKRCGASGGCFSTDTYKTLNKNVDWWGPSSSGYGYATAQLSNGLAFWISTRGSGCTTNRGATKELGSVCGYVGVDVNGFKKPNQLGRDTFCFYLTKYNVIPIGVKDDTFYTLSNSCRTSGTSATNGYACTAWVISKENMDYLKRNVSW